MVVHEEENIHDWFLDPESLGYHVMRDFLKHNVEV